MASKITKVNKKEPAKVDHRDHPKAKPLNLPAEEEDGEFAAESFTKSKQYTRKSYNKIDEVLNLSEHILKEECEDKKESVKPEPEEESRSESSSDDLQTETSHGSPTMYLIWMITEHPQTSSLARGYCLLQFFSLLVYDVAIFFERVVVDDYQYGQFRIICHFIYVYYTFLILFSLVFRIIVCPDLKAFFKGFINLSDIATLTIIIWYFVKDFDISPDGTLANSKSLYLFMIRSSELLIIFKLFKQSPYMIAYKIACKKALSMLSCIAAILMVITIVVGAHIYFFEKSYPYDSKAVENYEVFPYSSIFYGYYYAAQIVTTVGLGDFVVKTFPGYALSIFLMLLATSFLALSISTLGYFYRKNEDVKIRFAEINKFYYLRIKNKTRRGYPELMFRHSLAFAVEILNDVLVSKVPEDMKNKSHLQAIYFQEVLYLKKILMSVHNNDYSSFKKITFAYSYFLEKHSLFGEQYQRYDFGENSYARWRINLMEFFLLRPGLFAKSYHFFLNLAVFTSVIVSIRIITPDNYVKYKVAEGVFIDLYDVKLLILLLGLLIYIVNDNFLRIIVMPMKSEYIRQTDTIIAIISTLPIIFLIYVLVIFDVLKRELVSMNLLYYFLLISTLVRLAWFTCNNNVFQSICSTFFLAKYEILFITCLYLSCSFTFGGILLFPELTYKYEHNITNLERSMDGIRNSIPFSLNILVTSGTGIFLPISDLGRFYVMLMCFLSVLLLPLPLNFLQSFYIQTYEEISVLNARQETKLRLAFLLVRRDSDYVETMPLHRIMYRCLVPLEIIFVRGLKHLMIKSRKN